MPNRIQIEKAGEAEGWFYNGYRATWKDCFEAGSGREFAYTNMKQVDGHYVLQFVHVSPEKANEIIHLKKMSVFGVEHDEDKADERIYRKLLAMVKSREARRVNTELVDLVELTRYFSAITYFPQ